MQVASGSRLGPYEIVARIGAGGMGEVWRATDTRLDRSVAIKILPSEFAQNAQLRTRLEREAKTISQLNHPNICTLHDIGQQDGVDYLVMELLDGESLADRLERGPLPVPQVLQIGIEIASALDRAHRAGIIHRDLKPGNVVLTKSGAKLLDFGLAKPAVDSMRESVAISATRQKPLTEEGTIVGTYQYMSPEQVSGEPVDARSDIFAFGAVLYEMLTGKPAFRGKNRTSVVAAIISAEPQPISAEQPLTPPALERVIRTCLAKDPDDRWQTAHDVRLELEWIAQAGSQAGVAAPVVHRRRMRERTIAVVAALAVIAALALVAAYVRLARTPAKVLHVSIDSPPNATMSLLGENCGSLTVSPDGRFLTFMATDDKGATMLWLRPLDTGVAHPIAGTENAVFPFWSPDSRFIAFFAEGKLKKVDLTGAPAVSLCDVQQSPRSGSWNSDGTILFSPSSLAPVFRISASGGAAAAVTKLNRDAGETTHRWASFLPDGRHFLFMAGTHTAGTQSETNAVCVGSLDSPEKKVLFHARSNAVYASGRLLYVRDHVLVAQRFDARKLRLEGDPVPVAQDVDYESSFFRSLFAVSGEGTLVYQTGAVEAAVPLSVYDRSGKLVDTFGDPSLYRSVKLSPDGKQVAEAIEDSGSGNSSIWLYDLARRVRTRFTFGTTDQDGPIWSPDGSRVAYSSMATSGGQSVDIFMKEVSGGSSEVAVVHDATVKKATSWSPDGRYIAYDANDFNTKTRTDIWIVPLFGDRRPFPFRATQYDESFAQFSPDGHWIAYQSDESGRMEAYVVPFPSGIGKWQVSNNGGAGPHWRQDGRELTYLTPDASRMMAVTVEAKGNTVAIGTPAPLFDTSNSVTGDVSSDDQRLIMAKSPDAKKTPITLVTNWPATLPK